MSSVRSVRFGLVSVVSVPVPVRFGLAVTVQSRCNVWRPWATLATLIPGALRPPEF